jgi:hypothetical protein
LKKTAVLSLRLDVGETRKLGKRLATLLSLGLNRRHEDEGGDDGGWRSRWAQTLRHTRNQETEDAVVQSPRQHKAWQQSQKVHRMRVFPLAFTNHFLIVQERRSDERLSGGCQRGNPTYFCLHYFLIHMPTFYGAQLLTRGHRQDATWLGEVNSPQAHTPSGPLHPRPRVVLRKISIRLVLRRARGHKGIGSG